MAGSIYKGSWIPEVTPTGLACIPHVGHVPGAWIPEMTPTGLARMPHVGHVPEAWILEVTTTGLSCKPRVGHVPYLETYSGYLGSEPITFSFKTL